MQFDAITQIKNLRNHMNYSEKQIWEVCLKLCLEFVFTDIYKYGN